MILELVIKIYQCSPDGQERTAHNREVGGSSPPTGTINYVIDV